MSTREEERIIGMEAYKEGLLRWLEEGCHSIILKNNDMGDVYIGQMNAYKLFIDHITGTQRKKKRKASSSEKEMV